MRSRSLVLTVLLALVAVTAVGAQVSANGYDISSPDATSVPERTVDLQGQSHTVDAAIVADGGSQITVDVSAPDEVYRVYLYNSDEQIVEQQRGNGSDSFSFDLSGYEPGSYAITAHSRNSDQHEAIIPVLVRGYDVDASAPAEVDEGETFDVTIDVTPTASSGSPSLVKTVLVDADGEDTIEATGSDGSYTASVDAGTLSDGEYTVYGVVQGADTAFGRNELLGHDEAGTLTVLAASESRTDTETSGGGGGGGGGGGSAAAAETTTTPADTGEETEPTETAETQMSTETQTATPAATATETATAAPSPTTDDGAITPADETPTESTAGVDGPGFTVAGVAVALSLVVALLVVRTRRRQ